MEVQKNIILKAARLSALLDLALQWTDYVEVYDELTQLASQVIGTPVSLVSMVHSDHQYFKSHVGLPEPWKSRRSTPLSHSFCQHVVESNAPLIIEDAREHELVKDNLAIPDLNVIGYLGVPLTLEDGNTMGSFCVIDGEPRRWTDTEVAIMQEFAGILMQEFDIRVNIRRKENTNADLNQLHAAILEMLPQLDPSISHQAFLQQLRDLRQAYNV